MSESFNETVKQFVGWLNGLCPFVIVDPRCVFFSFPIKISQENRAAEKRSADGLPRINRPRITGGCPLERRRIPPLCFSQNLQSGFCSGVSFHHQNNCLVPQLFHFFIFHDHLLWCNWLTFELLDQVFFDIDKKSGFHLLFYKNPVLYTGRKLIFKATIVSFYFLRRGG